MNSSQEYKTFTVQFADKSIWNDFKEDLKATLNDNEIKFQYSEKTPTFYVFYKSDRIKIKVLWEEEILCFVLQAETSVNSEQIAVCRDIYDLLILFEGELIDGDSPYNW
ncbi:MAG: hypothetical protein ACFFB2_01385 [Promethearchaeota archaeon]